MALPSSGPISLDMIAAEFGGSPPHSLSEYYRGGPYVTANNTGIPTSGQISLDQFHGAVKVVPGSVTFSSPGTYTFTVPVYSSLTVYSDGAGGGGAAFGGYNGNAGGNSSFNGTVIGNGGGGGLYGATGPVSGGAAGSASGGDTNLSGSPGVAVGAGLRDATAGGASAAGGAGGAGSRGGVATAGGAPGGGGGGAGSATGGVGGAANEVTTGGGGGGRAIKNYAIGQLTPGASVTVVVGAGGAGVFPGASGANGQVTIVWS